MYKEFEIVIELGKKTKVKMKDSDKDKKWFFDKEPGPGETSEPQEHIPVPDRVYEIDADRVNDRAE